jgi:hypothetical protein
VTTIARGAMTASLAVAMLTIRAGHLDAQARRPMVPDLRNSSLLGVGYVASIPGTFLGFSALALTTSLFGGAGLYADVKFSPTDLANDPYFLDGVTVDEAEITYGDFLAEERSNWLSVSVAAVYAVAPEFGLFAGAGYTRERHYRQYFDDSQTRGEFGFYWIADPDASGNRVNALGGAFFRLSRYVLLQFGGQTQPRGVLAGVTLTLPI